MPIYQQIMSDLTSKILKGEIKKGEKLPSVRDIAKEYMVNPNTVQRVYTELEREMIVKSERGVGSFADLDEKEIEALRKREIKKSMEEFMDCMKSLGVEKEDIIMKIKSYFGGEYD